jgi:hypothetical protein
MQFYTVYLYLETALHVSGGTSTHHQGHIQLHLQHLVFVRPLLLSAAIVLQMPDAVDTVVCVPDDGSKYHPKHVQQFPGTNKLCKIASCCIYIAIYLRCTNLWTSNLKLTYKEFATFCIRREELNKTADNLFLRIYIILWLTFRYMFIVSTQLCVYILSQ